MAKILLVEDDKSLREIYGVRLMAEGYEIVSAGDGEEALAMAIKEKPDLIVSDVMMPKISGFDMLDIIRSTTETKNVKVIMMTALSSEDQRARGESLGADRYLVKSQVGIEDVVRTVNDVLGDSIATAPATPPAEPMPAPTPIVAPEPVTPVPQPFSQPQAPVVPGDAVAQSTPVSPVAAQPTPVPAQAPQAQQVATPTPQPVTFTQPTVAPTATPVTPPVQPIQTQPVAQVAPQPVAQAVPQPIAEPFVAPAPQAPAPQDATVASAQLPQPTAPFSSPAPASLGERVIEPLTDLNGPSSADIANQMAQALNDQPSTGIPPVPPA